jgi:hypothetical protein
MPVEVNTLPLVISSGDVAICVIPVSITVRWMPR